MVSMRGPRSGATPGGPGSASTGRNTASGSAARRLHPVPGPPSEGEGTAESEARLAARASEESAAEDRIWIARARQDDETAFAELVRKYQDRAIAVARHFVRDEEAARDVAQEGFLRVYRNLDRYDPKHRFYTWFYRIVVHLAIDRTRRRKRVQELLRQRAREPWTSPEDPSRPLERSDVRTQVEGILERLPKKYRVLLVLRDMEGFNSKEIAEISGSNHATVRWRLHRARQMFRDAWEAAGHAPVGSDPAEGRRAREDAGGDTANDA